MTHTEVKTDVCKLCLGTGTTFFDTYNPSTGEHVQYEEKCLCREPEFNDDDYYVRV